ncbi:MAG: hypothetical protein Q7K16_02775 [Candidatus Azambacteria bacterium]|nr:hypothetical protein [Candidatus Azambacteria bacterium]
MKKPFIVRWGNLILLLIAILLFVMVYGAVLKSKASGISSESERMIYGVIYLICVAGIFTLSIVRIVKKHHRILSVLWILATLILLYPIPLFFGKF